jgi:hypothetical protein
MSLVTSPYSELEPAGVAQRQSWQLDERSVGVELLFETTRGERMATKVMKMLIDDLDGTEASETIRFTIGGKSNEIDRMPNNYHKGDAQ